MSKKFKYLYQLRIALLDIKPEIWRIIQVPEDYSFWDLHVAIQDSFGWSDYHLHSFETTHLKTGKREVIGIPEKVYDEVPHDGVPTLPGWDLKVSDYLSEERRSILYIYDYGDNWGHLIQYEKILFRNPKQKYPLCLDGQRAGPPEDCGGSCGYKRFLKVINDPRHEEHKGIRTWAGKKKCATETFDPKTVRFDNPQKRWNTVFGNHLG